jgi:Domain of unknown function (DUF1772)
MPLTVLFDREAKRKLANVLSARSCESWRVDGRVENRRDNEPLDVAGISSWHSKHSSGVCGTDMFFLTIGRSALRLASPSAGTEVMGFLHMFADARMPIWGVSAILSNFLLMVLSRSGRRRFYFASLLMLILFVIIYNRLSKPINRLQTEAAKTGERLNNGRELQASWDRSTMIRVPLLVVSLLAQCLVLLVASA